MLKIPEQLKKLQEKILLLRKENKLELQNGDVGSASAPSNIALLKYWGKQGNLSQNPTNSSLSYTLGGFRSFTKVTSLGRFFPENEPNLTAKFSHKLILKNENNEIIDEQISKKMELFLNSILNPFAFEIALKVESRNNFPTACGIASSASGYAALVGAVANLLQLEKHFTPVELQYWLSEWARLGSGSATRSSLLQNNSLFVAWKLAEETSTTITESIKAHENWNNMKHCVLVLDATQKNISSSDGHKQAQSSPLHEIRVAGINKKYQRLLTAIEEFDFETVKQITEEDAFSMHAVMQTGIEPACYLNSQVAKVIAKFIQCRDKLNLMAFWTLDAGPNVHFIYHPSHEELLNYFFQEMQNVMGKKLKIYTNKNGDECLLF